SVHHRHKLKQIPCRCLGETYLYPWAYGHPPKTPDYMAIRRSEVAKGIRLWKVVNLPELVRPGSNRSFAAVQPFQSRSTIKVESVGSRVGNAAKRSPPFRKHRTEGNCPQSPLRILYGLDIRPPGINLQHPGCQFQLSPEKPGFRCTSL